MTRYRFNFLISLLCITCFLSGCATIYGRQNDKVNVFFDANVAGASVACDGVTIATPSNILLKQSKTHTCYASAEGYRREKLRVRSRVSKKGFQYSTDINTAKWGKWTLGIGTLIGWTVDFVSGSMRSFEKDRYDIELTPKEGASIAQKIWEKTTNIGGAVIELPKNVADGTTNAVLDATLRTSAEQVGLSSGEMRQDAEDRVEGKRLINRLEEKYDQ